MDKPDGHGGAADARGAVAKSVRCLITMAVLDADLERMFWNTLRWPDTSLWQNCTLGMCLMIGRYAFPIGSTFRRSNLARASVIGPAARREAREAGVAEKEEEGEGEQKTVNGTDEESTEEPDHSDVFAAGCTALTCLVRGDRVLCANTGDSRAVLCQKGKAVPLSTDHKPNVFEEARRIIKVC